MVWIVDDSESVRKSVAAVLETANMEVRDYASAAAFLADFKPGSTGCLVLDHHMPDMTGLQLLQRLQADGEAPPTIIITGQGDEALKQRALAAGAIAYINKPLDAGDLIELVERAILNPP